MEGDTLILNMGGSRLHSEDDLDDINPTNKIFPITIKNIPLDFSVLELLNPDQKLLEKSKTMDLFKIWVLKMTSKT